MKIERALKIFNKKNIFWMLVIILLISLVPILMLAGYNYPCADDFSASDTAYFAWRDTRSIFQVIKAAAENVVDNYKEWSGVFASVFWTSLQPGIFGERYYGITTWITVILLIISCGYFFKVVLGDYLEADFYDTGIITLVFLVSLIQCMPSGLEGLFWHAAVVNYTWAFCFLLLLIGVILSGYREKNRKNRVVKIIVAILLAVFVGGGNYITALQGCIWYTLLLIGFGIYEIKIQQNTIKVYLGKQEGIVLPYLVLLVAFGMSVAAPGNDIRMGSSDGFGALKSVLVSFHYCLEEPIENWLSWPILLLLFIAIPSMVAILKEGIVVVSDIKLVLGLSLGFGVVSAGFTPSLYAQASMEAGRLHNTVYFIWLLVLYLQVMLLISWIMSKVSMTEENNFSLRLVSGVLLGCFLGLSILCGAIDEKVYIGFEAMTSMMSGEAEHYKIENEIRLQELKDPSKAEVEFERFYAQPSLLLFQDLSPDPNEWVNTVVAEYYGKKSVTAR